MRSVVRFIYFILTCLENKYWKQEATATMQLSPLAADKYQVLQKQLDK